MKLSQIFKGGENKRENRLALKAGSYSLMVSALVLAILIVVNIFVSALPSSMTKYDISATKLYSITSNTKVVVNSLDQDVTIYWIVQSGQEDAVIENLLSKYEALSDHIKVEKRNPDVYPTFAQQYTSETVANNSLVVECGDRSRYIGYDDIYLQEADVYSYSYSTSFDGEGAITSAIDYVVREELPQLYVLEGHGESELPATFSEQIEKDNMEVKSLSLLTVDETPEDAACLIIYAPQSDISEEESEMLSDYVSHGGKLLVMSGPVQDGSLDNLNSLLDKYGVTVTDGIVVEGDREHYAFQAPYVLLPDMNSHAITDSLIEENYFAIMPISQGLTVGESSNGTVTPLLTTSDYSYSKADAYDLETYEKEEGDTDGPFNVAALSENGGKLFWVTSDTLLDSYVDSAVSGANSNLFMNALNYMCEQEESISIRAKSLDSATLTVPQSESTLWSIVMIGVIPVGLIVLGMLIWIRRKRR